MSIIQRIKDWVEYKRIKNSTDKETIKALEGGEISEKIIPKAVGTIEGVKEQEEALIGIIGKPGEKPDEKTIEGVVDNISEEALVEAYKNNDDARKGIINFGGTNNLVNILWNPKIKKESEIYNIAINGNENNDFDFANLLRNIIEDEKKGEYNPEKLLKYIAGRLKRNIENFGGPIHYQIFIELMKTDEEKLMLPDYLKKVCEIEIAKKEKIKNRPDKMIEKLKEFDPDKLRIEIEEFIKSKENLKSKDTSKQDNLR